MAENNLQHHCFKSTAKMNDLLKVLLFAAFLVTTSCETYTPVVLWHGLGEPCCNASRNIVGNIKINLEEYMPGIHVVILRIGNSPEEDYSNGFTMHPDKQIEIACNIIKSDPLLANGYNGITISQGSQLLRGLAQRCPEPRLKNLITLAGQHQGVYGVPACETGQEFITLCKFINFPRLVNQFVYLGPIQNSLTPSTYWHNPLNKKSYVEGSTFLADINNERIINQTYIKNLQQLENFVMIKYEADEVVQPIETSWFGFYKDGQARKIETLQESELYLSDRLGLKKMDEDGKLHFVSNSWSHFEFNWAWFQDNIVDKYLR